MSGARRFGACLLFVLSSAGSSASLAGEPAPYDLLLEIGFRGATGDQTVREEIELRLLGELSDAGCFRSIAVAPADGEAERDDEPGTDALVLRITFDEVFEETTYDTSVAARADPQRPPEYDMMLTARFRAQARAELLYGAQRTLLRERRLRGTGSHRPLFAGEDARGAALSDATEEVAHAARVFACKGGASRLAKEIRNAGSD